MPCSNITVILIYFLT